MTITFSVCLFMAVSKTEYVAAAKPKAIVQHNILRTSVECLKEFENSFFFGFVVSSVLFGMWHISLWYLKGITYHGGFAALVGGAFAMGLLWSYSARKLKNITLCIYAHILVNIFAFTGLFVDNNF